MFFSLKKAHICMALSYVLAPIDSPNLSHHCAIVQNDSIILIGGWNGSSRISDVFIYNITNGEIKMASSTGTYIIFISHYFH